MSEWYKRDRLLILVIRKHISKILVLATQNNYKMNPKLSPAIVFSQVLWLHYYHCHICEKKHHNILNYSNASSDIWQSSLEIVASELLIQISHFHIKHHIFETTHHTVKSTNTCHITCIWFNGLSGQWGLTGWVSSFVKGIFFCWNHCFYHFTYLSLFS